MRGLLALSLARWSLATDSAAFAVTNEPEHQISPNLYSIFFETEINFGSVSDWNVFCSCVLSLRRCFVEVTGMHAPCMFRPA
jgi:hypothetical protein